MGGPRRSAGKAYGNEAEGFCFHPQVILASGYHAVFRVTLAAKDLEGPYDAAIHITTDFEVSAVLTCGSAVHLSCFYQHGNIHSGKSSIFFF